MWEVVTLQSTSSEFTSALYIGFCFSPIEYESVKVVVTAPNSSHKRIHQTSMIAFSIYPHDFFQGRSSTENPEETY
jgi:hypothetical protein